MPINSFLYPAKNVPVVYEVANSCRFNDGDSPHLERAASNSANQNLFTYSLWVKPSSTTGGNLITFRESSVRYCRTFFESGKLCIKQAYDGTTEADVKTTALYRDPTAWMHIVIAVDTAQSTNTNRIKMYVNGSQVTNFSTTTWPSQNQDLVTRTTSYVGQSGDDDNYFDGYMTEVCYIDGTAYAASDFGEFDSDSPTVWKPKDPSGLTFGTNGFYLDFEDSSNLGNDANGGTDYGENNIVAADQATDTCTNNFCTVNPLDQYGTYTLSEGNCQITSGHTSWYTIGSTMAVSNGKWYYEVEFDAGTMIEIFVGVHDTSVSRVGTNAWLTGSSLFYNDAGGEIRTDGTNSTADYGTLSAGDILGIALNMDDKQITLYKNGSAIASNVALSTSISEAMPTFLTDSNDVVFKVNFGGCPSFAISSGNADGNGYGNFEYSVPSNYYSLCSKNLAEYGG